MSDPGELMRQLDDLHHRIQSYLDSWQTLPELLEPERAHEDVDRPRDGGFRT
jgi:hypothetical protein